ncbi:hypothetical protein GcM1_207043 [Golovinomyces cichoracearum]|uniref:Uncharacterized protein n=1 Tax=Golovinomyces cichoracearum TaxID=62708 RepID=A0A420IWI6_9PEZI|nr:hypothetical protein GcM1_207043 [Golovinomyces cichoracearum]
MEDVHKNHARTVNRSGFVIILAYTLQSLHDSYLDDDNYLTSIGTREQVLYRLNIQPNVQQKPLFDSMQIMEVLGCSNLGAQLLAYEQNFVAYSALWISSHAESRREFARGYFDYDKPQICQLK